MGIKTLITYDFGKERVKELEELGCELILRRDKSVVYEDELSDIEVVIGYDPFANLDISSLKKLKWIQLVSAGIDKLPAEYVIENNIMVSNNKGYSIPIGEWIVFNILELLKQSARLYHKQSLKVWKIQKGILELYGKNVGFIGTGAIAKEAAKRVQCFEARTLGLNTKGTETQYFDECFSTDRLDEMLRLSDIVVVTVPYTESVFHLIDGDRINKMKDGVLFVNISRGTIVDEEALIEGLRRGKIAGAALDVFEQEPLSQESPLWDMENVIVTPHNSFYSDKREDRMYETIYSNMKRYIEGKKIENVVDLKRGY
ncbi:MAG: phosphoglycerate dehydrogenase [Clostridiaceae bacterium]